MLYKTHQRFGQMFGLIGLILSFAMSVIPTMSLTYTMSMNIYVMIIVYVAYRSALFGSEFPDIDSPGSVPARHWVIIRRVFKVFNIKHRGKFSHDFIFLGLFFLLMYLVGDYLLGIGNENTVTTMVAMIGLSYFISKDIANELVFKFVKNRKRRGRVSFIIGFFLTIVILMVIGVLGYMPSGGSGQLIKSTSFVGSIYRVFIIFTLIGAYSHLFADLLTNEGVNILGKSIQPARFVMRVNKLPFILPAIVAAIGYLMGNIWGLLTGLVFGFVIQMFILKTDLKTGSQYEEFTRRIITITLVPIFILTVYAMVGGNIQNIINLIR